MKYCATFNVADLKPFIEEIKTNIQYEMSDTDDLLDEDTAHRFAKEAVNDMIELIAEQLRYEFNIKA